MTADVLDTELLLELLADGVVVEPDDGVTLGVPLGSVVPLEVDEPLVLPLLGVGATVPNTGPVRVGEPVEDGVPVGVGVPVDFVGLGDVLVGVVVVLVVDGACVGTFDRGTTTGTPGRWVRVLGGTNEGTRVAWSRDVPEVRVASIDHGADASVDRGAAEDGAGATTADGAGSPQNPWVTCPNWCSTGSLVPVTAAATPPTDSVPSTTVVVSPIRRAREWRACRPGRARDVGLSISVVHADSRPVSSSPRTLSRAPSASRS